MQSYHNLDVFVITFTDYLDQIIEGFNNYITLNRMTNYCSHFVFKIAREGEESYVFCSKSYKISSKSKYFDQILQF
jgi:hypothetical protein